MKCKNLLVSGLISISFAFAGTKKVVLKFTSSDVKFENIGSYTLIKYPHGFSAGNPGEPLLPALNIKVLLPASAQDLKAKITSENVSLLKKQTVVYPVQAAVPLIKKDIRFFPPSSKVYSSSNIYPESQIFSQNIGNLGGYKIATLVITPFKYLPGEKNVYFINEMEIEITYREGASCPVTDNQSEIYKNALKGMVINPEDIDLYSPPIKSVRQNGYQEVIVTSSSLAGYFQPLIKWRTKTGIKCTLVTTEEIYSSYPGWDDAEKLRNFLIDKYNSWGLEYAILAGDTNVVPVRKIYSTDTLGQVTWAPSDWYFADMNGGSWDADGDHFYGELEDSSEIDLYGDLFVGRMCVETPQEIQNIINKIITYEKTAGVWVTKVLLPAVWLWSGMGYDGKFVNDSIAAVTPTGITDIKIYESAGTLHRNSTRDSINNGVGFVHFSAHGNNQGTYWEGGVDTVLHTFDISQLINGNKLAIYTSIACFPGAFDNMTPYGPDSMGDCFAEKLMYHSEGGPVGVIMNTRFGLGTPPTMGPSELLDLQFYKRTFTIPMYRFGIAHTISKNDFVPPDWNQSDMPMVACIGELTLFGDPAMPMWTGNPVSQNVSYPDSIGTGSQTFTVTVADNQGAVEGALVCIWSKTNGIYETQTTNTSGFASFNISPQYYDTMWVTSTCMNHIPYEGYTIITGTVSAHESQITPALSLKIYPNITSGKLKLILSRYIGEKIRVNIFDVSGKKINARKYPLHKAKMIELNLNKLASGTYIIHIQRDHSKFRKKIILVK